MFYIYTNVIYSCTGIFLIAMNSLIPVLNYIMKLMVLITLVIIQIHKMSHFSKFIIYLLSLFYHIMFIYRFMFPSGNSSNLISLDEKEWAIIINATYSPSDEEDDEAVASSLLVRQKPSDKLYQKFGIGVQFSYACAAEQYNTYNTSSNYSLVDDDEVFASGNSAVILKGIQVMRYIVFTYLFIYITLGSSI